MLSIEVIEGFILIWNCYGRYSTHSVNRKNEKLKSMELITLTPNQKVIPNLVEQFLSFKMSLVEMSNAPH